MQVKVYLPQDPQEAFFNETISLFRQEIIKLQEIISPLEQEIKTL